MSNSTLPTATDAQGVGEAPKAVAWQCRRGEGSWGPPFTRKSHVDAFLPDGYEVRELGVIHHTASTTAGLTDHEVDMLHDSAYQLWAIERSGITWRHTFATAIQRACAEKWNVRLDGGAAK